MLFKIIAADFITISPTDYPIRTPLFTALALLLAHYSLCFLRKVNFGSTIVVNPRNILRTFSVVSGKYNLPTKLTKQGFIKSYNGPGVSAFLGLLMFAVSEFLIVILFKRIDYTFAPF
ncbi:hypothetical protein A2397_02740 [Candidatus Amesbacteria bacterium RIFOXYB1_FULL_44_23]|uniref:Uncharacterized protein n=1 Tax=Candidatus Amesbacteria bacterium RIFOXYB1_FULL_44_23 TaxID=1797263 RepID=A0A1F4ZS05_9BACT|nr:MAG: hypothetical protein A2397_02740 [Candidatus Amesbacteria bacterium RIFOXYB1_FULL_44_23]